jgi:hypothetical protein
VVRAGRRLAEPECVDLLHSLQPREVPSGIRRAVQAVEGREPQVAFPSRCRVQAVLTARDGRVVAVRLWDKPKALEMLFKHLGLLKESVAHAGAVEIRWKGDE